MQKKKIQEKKEIKEENYFLEKEVYIISPLIFFYQDQNIFISEIELSLKK